MASKNQDVMRQAVAAINRGDIDAALEVTAEDAVLIPQRAATEGAYRGHSGAREWFADTAETFELFRWNISELRDLGDRVVAIGKIHIRARGSGLETDITSAGIATFRAGKVVRWEDFGDAQRALETAAGSA